MSFFGFKGLKSKGNKRMAWTIERQRKWETEKERERDEE
jgi:hypothetical protein